MKEQLIVKNPPDNTYELFCVLCSMTSKELCILDSLVYLDMNYDHYICASNDKKALNSGCSKTLVKQFERKYEGIIFYKTRRINQTNEIILVPLVSKQLTDLKLLIKHLKNLKKYKKTLEQATLYNSLNFSDLIIKIGGAVKKSKLFITSEKEANSKIVVHNFKSHRGNKEVMNRNGTKKCPPNRVKNAPNIIYTLRKEACQPFYSSSLKKSHVFKVLKQYQMLSNLNPEKIKAWEKYSEVELIRGLECLFYAMRNPKSTPMRSIEAYLETALQKKYVPKTLHEVCSISFKDMKREGRVG